MYLCKAIRKESKTYLLNSLSITTRERANTYYWDCTMKAQISPYICVACGEPRDVWRRSAPLSLKNNIDTLAVVPDTDLGLKL